MAGNSSCNNLALTLLLLVLPGPCDMTNVQITKLLSLDLCIYS